MVGFLLRAAITALGLWVASEILPGLAFDSTTKLVIKPSHMPEPSSRTFKG